MNFRTKISILGFFQEKRIFFLASIICLILLSFDFIPLSIPGIDQPTAIGPYLNGILPTAAPSGTNENWVVENAFPHLTFGSPIALLEVPGENSYYVASIGGMIVKISKDSSTTVKDTVLDLSEKVATDIDAGLLNAILHPEFGQPSSPNRGYMYIFYRWLPGINPQNCGPGFLRLSRFTRPDGLSAFDPNSELVLIQTYDEQCWHNGGAMLFDQEGYFYYTVGDAGGFDDTFQTTQKIHDRLMSGLFRIDLEMDSTRSHPIRRQQVDPPNSPFASDSSFAQGYYIPNDNPWLDQGGSILEEYYTIGLRSPHRASIDTVTGHIWVGDVGQGSREEISLITTKGMNLQWPFREGSIKGNVAMPDPLIGISTPPIYDYDHSIGNAIIGGFVYRGNNYQGSLDGKYIFGDHGVRNIWSYNPTNAEVRFMVNVPPSGFGAQNGISSFSLNSEGEVLILKLYGKDHPDGGVIYKLKEETTVPEPPPLLSQTGVFNSLDSLSPAPGIIPYSVNAPLWSDRAEKKRWIALPNDGTHDTPQEQIIFSLNDSWQYPPGTVFIKQFDLPVDFNNPDSIKRVETRFFVITSTGAYGVTYKWNDAGTDAELIVNGESKNFNVTLADNSTMVQTWDFPSRSACLTCHNDNAGLVLGVHTSQLNGDLLYPTGITDNQLNTWHHLGMFANPFDPIDITGFLKSANIKDNTATLETKVRSYIDANCAHCHRPGGVEGAFDGRFSSPLENQNIVWAFPGSRNTPESHYIIKPLDLSESEIWLRDASLGANAMPPLAKRLVDSIYIDSLTAWINNLQVEACQEMIVSSLNWASAVNGQGPVEINSSVNTGMPNDGNPITINGQIFPLGLGVHAYSEITYQVNNDYALFQSYIGVDDETCELGSVQFLVYKDSTLAYQSPIMTQADDALLIKVNIEGANQVKLVVTDGGTLYCDHADWADPRFFPCLPCITNAPCDDGDPCTENDRYDNSCNCVGDTIDSDNDGIPDCDDECIGMQASSCPSGDCPVDDQSIPSGTYAGLIRVSSLGTVGSESNVTFESATQIELQPGFAVEAGGLFEAYIVECENIAARLTTSEHKVVGWIEPIIDISTDRGSSEIVIKYDGLSPLEPISIQLIDLSGQIIDAPIDSDSKEIGIYRVHLSTNLSAGVYYLKFQSEKGSSLKRVIIDGLRTTKR